MKKTTRFFTVLLVLCFSFGTHAQELVKPYENMLEYVKTQKGKAENFQKFQIF